MGSWPGALCRPCHGGANGSAQVDVLPATPDVPINIILVQGELVAI
jgi:hypothetical protein